MQLIHHRPATLLMKPQPLVRLQVTLTGFGIVAIHLAQHLQHVAAFAGKVRRHFYKLSPTVRQAIGQQNLHSAG